MHHFSKVAGVTALTLALTTLSGCQTLKNSKLFGGKEDVIATKAEKSEQGYYQAASDNIKKDNYAKAISQLTDLRTFYPVGDYSEQALLDLMYAQYQHGDYLDAIASVDRFIQSYPSNPQVDYAYYVRGISNMQAASTGVMKYTKLNPAHRDMGYSRLAFNDFQQLVTRFPNSAYAPDAALRMRFIYNQLAESEMEAARWYIKRQAYVAAANRAKWVFQYFPQSEAIPESIATLAYSYDKLGMTDTANQYKQLLRINYPGLIDAGGNVQLANTRTGSDWLNKATLGVLGRSSKTAAIQGLAQQSGQDQGTTKPQVIQTSIQQAAAMRLPNPATDNVSSLKPRDTTIGLALPPDNTSQVR